jgi:hypothetical protein
LSHSIKNITSMLNAVLGSYLQTECRRPLADKFSQELRFFLGCHSFHIAITLGYVTATRYLIAILDVCSYPVNEKYNLSTYV